MTTALWVVTAVTFGRVRFHAPNRCTRAHARACTQASARKFVDGEMLGVVEYMPHHFVPACVAFIDKCKAINGIGFCVQSRMYA